MNWAKKVDGNQKEIIEKLRAAGFTARSIAAAGRGIPDLLVGVRGVNYLFEVKMPGEKLTPLEQKFFDEWGGQVSVIECANDALMFIRSRS